MVEYDRRVIQEFAERLYRRAKTTIVVCTLVGLIGGAVFGYVISQSVRGSSPAVLVAICAAVIAALCYFIGVERSFKLRLLAQTAMCQVMIEANTCPAARTGTSSVARPLAASTIPAMTAAAR